MAIQATVIGAGPAGLTAAYELNKLGMKSTVLESDDIVGGISRTVNYKGYRFDIGGHRFFSKVQMVNDLWNEILGEAFLLRPRMSRIHYRGHFFDYPLKAMNALAGLGPIESAMVCLSYAKAKFFPSKQESTFEQWVANRFGYRLYQIFFKTYTEKVWGIPCTEISADWAAQRIKNLSLKEAIRNALFPTSGGKTADGKVITTLIDEFHYPRFGPGMMWERCEELLAKSGNPTHRGIRVDKIRHRTGRVEAVYGEKDGGERVEVGGDHFISSMPMREMINAMDPAPPAEVLKAANSLRYRDYLTVVLIAERDAIFPDNWIYIHSPEVKMGRVQNYKNWSPHMVPDAKRTSLGLEYFLWDKDDEWRWPNERLIELGVRECAQIGLAQPNEIADGTVVRMPKAYPVYDQEYQHHVDVIRRWLETLTNFQTVGRNGLHRYNNQDHSMVTAVYAARNIVGERNDIWAVNTEMEYHEEDRKPKSAAKPTLGDRMVPTRVLEETPEGEPTPDDVIEKVFARLDPVALGVSIGTVLGVGLFLMTITLLIQHGPQMGATLGLLRHYLFGYEVSWGGAFLGLFQAGLGGFVIGYALAHLRNWGMAAYAYLLKRRAEAEEERDLLDKV
ncbi:MAG: NAD(P)/FAD-dependent oxidoreductase [Phycisphaerae bacterium]